MVRDILTTRSGVRRWLACGFLIALNLVVPLAQAAETVTYYYTNQQGTPLATADASGNVLSTSDYRPYGGQVLGAPAGGPGYTGHVNDSDSGLVYMQARYYDPVVGRFLSTDPAGTQPGDASKFGRFGYASDNPIRFVDPDGKQEEEDAEEIAIEMRQIMARLNPPLGPNMAAPGYVPPPTPLPMPESYSDRIVDEQLGLVPGVGPQVSVGPVEPIKEEQSERTYQVYTKENAETGKTYTGRTSGFGTPEENVARRDQGHHMTASGYGRATMRYSSSSYEAARGQEQIMILKYGGAQSSGGTSGNAINGISGSNDRIKEYWDAAAGAFGNDD